MRHFSQVQQELIFTQFRPQVKGRMKPIAAMVPVEKIKEGINQGIQADRSRAGHGDTSLNSFWITKDGGVYSNHLQGVLPRGRSAIETPEFRQPRYNAGNVHVHSHSADNWAHFEQLTGVKLPFNTFSSADIRVLRQMVQKHFGNTTVIIAGDGRMDLLRIPPEKEDTLKALSDREIEEAVGLQEGWEKRKKHPREQWYDVKRQKMRDFAKKHGFIFQERLRWKEKGKTLEPLYKKKPTTYYPDPEYPYIDIISEWEPEEGSQMLSSSKPMWAVIPGEAYPIEPMQPELFRFPRRKGEAMPVKGKRPKHITMPAWSAEGELVQARMFEGYAGEFGKCYPIYRQPAGLSGRILHCGAWAIGKYTGRPYCVAYAPACEARAKCEVGKPSPSRKKEIAKWQKMKADSEKKAAELLQDIDKIHRDANDEFFKALRAEGYDPDKIDPADPKVKAIQKPLFDKWIKVMDTARERHDKAQSNVNRANYLILSYDYMQATAKAVRLASSKGKQSKLYKDAVKLAKELEKEMTIYAAGFSGLGAEEPEKWIQAVGLKRGEFTKLAASMGMTAQQFIKEVLSHKQKYSPGLVKAARLRQTLTRIAHGEYSGAFTVCNHWQYVPSDYYGKDVLRCAGYAPICDPAEKCLTEAVPALPAKTRTRPPGARRKAERRARPPVVKVLKADLTTEEKKVADAIGEGKIHIDEVSRKSGLAPYQVSAALVMLELKGLARQSAGKMFQMVRDNGNGLSGLGYAVKAGQKKVCRSWKLVPSAHYGKDISRCKEYAAACTEAACLPEPIPAPKLPEPTKAEVKSIAKWMAAEWNESAGWRTPGFIRQIMDRGGIRPYRGKTRAGKVDEEYMTSVPLFMRRKAGLPPDEMADEMGFDSDTEMYRAIQSVYGAGARKEAKKLKRKKASDFMEDAYDYLQHEMIKEM